MKQEIIIGISIVLVIVLTVGIHGWLHRLLKFKMDESTILALLRDSNIHHNHPACQTTEAIAKTTSMTPERVNIVCSKSTAIVADCDKTNLWLLK